MSQYYKVIEIKSEEDLPKEAGDIFFRHKNGDYHSCYYYKNNAKEYLQYISWLQPVTVPEIDWEQYASIKAQEFAEKQLEPLGHTITHKWWVDEGKGYDGDLEHYKHCAVSDFVAVHTADRVVILNTQERGKETSGKAVEMGLALDWGIPVIVVASWTNVFHYFPGVRLVSSEEEALEAIKG